MKSDRLLGNKNANVWRGWGWFITLVPGFGIKRFLLSFTQLHARLQACNLKTSVYVTQCSYLGLLQGHPPSNIRY